MGLLLLAWQPSRENFWLSRLWIDSRRVRCWWSRNSTTPLGRFSRGLSAEMTGLIGEWAVFGRVSLARLACMRCVCWYFCSLGGCWICEGNSKKVSDDIVASFPRDILMIASLYCLFICKYNYVTRMFISSGLVRSMTVGPEARRRSRCVICIMDGQLLHMVTFIAFR